MQYYNDVFQCGGYVTVSEFIEKYKSSYSFEFDGEPVTDDTLNIGVKPNIKNGVPGNNWWFDLVPKFTVKDYEDEHVKPAYFVNPTDKEIPISECYINLVDMECAFYPKALNEEITDIPEFLKGLGYEDIGYEDVPEIKPSMEYNKKFCTDSVGSYWFFEVGETNAFGAKPLYKYWIYRDTYTPGEVKYVMRGLRRVGYIFE